MEINIKWNICRICLKEQPKTANESRSDGGSQQMRNIFHEDKKLVQHIYDFSGVIMKPNDSLPDKICLKCLTMVNNAVQFRKNCRVSNTYLKTILERTKKASSFFKPELPITEVSEDDLEEMDKEATIIVENKIEYSHVKNFKDGDKNQQLQHLDKQLENKEIIENLQHHENDIDDAIENTELGEKITKQSEDLTDQKLIQTIEDSSEEMNQITRDIKEDSKANNEVIKPKTSQLQKFYLNARKPDEELSGPNETENMETGLNDTKIDNEELYYLIKDIKNEDQDSCDNHVDLEEPQDEHSMTGESVEYYAIEEEENEEFEVEEDIDEELMMNLEDKDAANQAQVSSTVDTNDEAEYHESNPTVSNSVNDLEEEYVVDDNLCSYNTSSSKKTSQVSSVTKTHISRKAKISENSSSEESSRPIKWPKKNHLSVSQIKASVCEICGNQFYNRNLMKIHMKVHYQEKNHECELCFKRFITACNLQAHMRIHTGERPFECKFCGRRFNDRSSNLRHERTHTNEKPFKCVNCGKNFSLATTLQNHMKIHTNERSYRCEPCGKSFKLSHHLKTHQNTSLHRSVLGIGVEEN